VVFAAASLKNALDEIAVQWQRVTGKKVVILLCGQQHADQTDRARRASRHIYFG